MHAGMYPEVPPDFGNWLAGWIDGEGSFVIPHTNKLGYVCVLSVCVRDDDGPVLEEIVKRTSLGAVYYRSPHTRDRNNNPQAMWKVQKKSEIVRLVELLDRFPLRAKKAGDYALWREAALIWGAMRPRFRAKGIGKGRLENDWERVAELRQQLMDGRAYTPPPSRPQPERPPALWES